MNDEIKHYKTCPKCKGTGISKVRMFLSIPILFIVALLCLSIFKLDKYTTVAFLGLAGWAIKQSIKCEICRGKKNVNVHIDDTTENEGKAKVLDVTNGYIELKLYNKIIKIESELLIDGILVYKDTIRKWEPPYDNEVIDEETKEKIVQHIIEEFKKDNLKVKIK